MRGIACAAVLVLLLVTHAVAGVRVRPVSAMTGPVSPPGRSPFQIVGAPGTPTRHVLDSTPQCGIGLEGAYEENLSLH